MRYINVEDAVKIASEECGEFRGVFARIKEGLEAIPTADVVKVVWCKDCIYSQDIRACNLPYGRDGYCPLGKGVDDAV